MNDRTNAAGDDAGLGLPLMKFFGEPYPSRERSAPIYEGLEQVAPPLFEPCLHCAEPIAPGDRGFVMPYPDAQGRGVAMHHECFLRTLLGSVSHQRRLCSCYGGTDDDNDIWPRSAREDARLAFEEFERRQREENA
jgi:hypothetical protein